MHAGRKLESRPAKAGIVAARGAILLMSLLLTVAGAGCGRRAQEGDGESLLHEAWRQFRLADYRMALESFEQALAVAATGSDLWLQALYGQAVTWDLRQPVPTQDEARAAALYRQVIEEAPHHDLAAWSALALARMQHLVPVGQEPDYALVRDAYQDVIDRFPGHLAATEALMYQQATLIQSLDPQSTRRAMEQLQRFVDRKPDSPFLSAAYALLAEGYRTLEDGPGELQARLRELETMEVDPTSPAASDLAWRYWQIASTAEFLAGEFEVARMYYRRLIEEYPLDFRRFGARQALARMDALERRLREGAAP